MCPSLPAFAQLAGALDTGEDARAAAKAISAGTAAASAATAALSAELAQIIRALHNPSPRAFRLALAALTPALDITRTVHLSHQSSSSHTHGTLFIHVHMIAWHYFTLHTHLVPEFTSHSASERFI
eukprot:1076527-Rhodomonas_salina.1